MTTTKWIALLIVVAALAGSAAWMLRRGDPASQDTAGAGIPAASEPAAGDETRGLESSETSKEAPPEGSGAAAAAAFRQLLAARDLEPGAIAAGQLAVIGRVVSRKEDPEAPGEDLEPISGAELAFFVRNADGSIDGVAAAQAISRDDGYFLVTLPSRKAWHIRGSAPGYVPGGPDIAAVSAPGRDVGDIVLLRTAGVAVTVTTGTREMQEEVQPVPGMKFEVYAGDEVIARGSTSDDGRLELTGLPRATLRFSGHLDPYAHVDEAVDITRNGQEIRFNVDVVGSIRVRAQARSGALLARFSVAVDIVRNVSQYHEPRYVDLETEDPDGWAVIEGIRAGKVDVYATAKGFALGLTRGVVVEPATSADATVELPPGFPLRGRVVSKKTGNPVADAIVFSERDLIPYAVDNNSRDAFRPMARAVRSDARGNFRLEDLNGGTHSLTAVHPEFAATSALSVEVGEDGAKEVVIEMRGGCTLSGHVYDDSGVPLAGVQIMVFALMDANRSKKVPLMATTDDGGLYRIEHVHPGFQGILKMNPKPAPGEQAYEMKQQRFTDGQDVVVDFGKPGAGAIVRGRITNRDGSPATDVTVLLMEATSENEIPPFFTGSVDPQSNYEVKSVPAGTYVIRLGRAGKGGSFHGQETLKVPDSGVVNRDIVVAGGSLRGTLVSATTGKPLRQGDVLLFSGWQNWIGRSDIDPDGSYSFDFVAAGRYQIYAEAKDHGTKTLEDIVVVDGEQTEVPPIEMAGGGRVVGRVLDATGQPVVGATIRVVDPKTGAPAPVWGGFDTDEEGRFEITHIPAGTYGITAQKDGLSFKIAAVTVEISGAPQVVVRAE